jgi:hypothetical protein
MHCFCCTPACVQLVEIMPCLDTLPQLLGRPYSLVDEDAGLQADVADASAGPDDMDVDGPGAAAAGPGSRHQQGYFTLEELLDRVQVCVLAHSGSAVERWP